MWTNVMMAMESRYMVVFVTISRGRRSQKKQDVATTVSTKMTMKTIMTTISMWTLNAKTTMRTAMKQDNAADQDDMPTTTQ